MLRMLQHMHLIIIIHVTELIELMLDVMNMENGGEELLRSIHQLRRAPQLEAIYKSQRAHSELTAFLCSYNNPSHISETSRHCVHI